MTLTVALLAYSVPIINNSQALTNIPASPAPGQRPRRLPGFFSTIGKSNETAKEEKAEIAQARIARATRSKAASGNTSKVAAVTSEKPTTASKPAEKATPRPAGSLCYLMIARDDALFSVV